jgi:hypothetical protein
MKLGSIDQSTIISQPIESSNSNTFFFTIYLLCWNFITLCEHTLPISNQIFNVLVVDSRMAERFVNARSILFGLVAKF